MTSPPPLSQSHEGARLHYNRDGEDRFYHRGWAGDDLYIGIGWFESDADSVYEACRRLVEKMAERLPHRGPGTRMLELGSGYGAAARYVARERGFQVDCLNLSDKQNQQNQQRNDDQGLSEHIRITPGYFENLSFAGDANYDVVWSQDAIIHSPNKPQVFAEVNRVLKPGGDLVLVDVLQSAEGGRDDFVQFIVNYFHLESLGSFDLYRQLAAEHGWQEIEVLDVTDQLVAHYQRLQHQLAQRYGELLDEFSAENLDGRKDRLQQWLMAGQEGNLEWGLFHFRKSS